MRLPRREFVQTLAALPLAARAEQQMPTGRARASAEKFVGMQMGPHSMLGEGIDRVLDRLQTDAAVNSVVVYSHTYYTADGIRSKRSPAVLAPGHGVPVRDLNTRHLPYGGCGSTSNISKTQRLRLHGIDRPRGRPGPSH